MEVCKLGSGQGAFQRTGGICDGGKWNATQLRFGMVDVWAPHASLEGKNCSWYYGFRNFDELPSRTSHAQTRHGNARSNPSLDARAWAEHVPNTFRADGSAPANGVEEIRRVDIPCNFAPIGIRIAFISCAGEAQPWN